MTSNNRFYKQWLPSWIHFGCEELAPWQRVIIDYVDHNTVLRTDINEKANWHWSYSSDTLASGRIFKFTGKVFGTDKENRELAKRALNFCIQPDGQPYTYGRGFYDLTRTDGAGLNKIVKAKVYKAPEYSSGGSGANFENVEFELLAENETIFTDERKEVNGVVWGSSLWIMTLDTTFPVPLDDFEAISWNLICNNEWNRQTPLRLEINGEVKNPKIINLTNSMGYKLGKTTTKLVYDNINTENDPRKNLLITDNGVNISEFRINGGWIYLQPWINQIVVLSDEPSTATVKVLFRDGRIW